MDIDEKQGGWNLSYGKKLKQKPRGGKAHRLQKKAERLNPDYFQKYSYVEDLEDFVYEEVSGLEKEAIMLIDDRFYE